LLLTPSIDHLFDRGFITFENDGRLLVSAVAHKESLRRMGVSVDEVRNVGAFTERQKSYLEFHRENLFLEANL
jgi:putative restriction endonuclease